MAVPVQFSECKLIELVLGLLSRELNRSSVCFYKKIALICPSADVFEDQPQGFRMSTNESLKKYKLVEMVIAVCLGF